MSAAESRAFFSMVLGAVGDDKHIAAVDAAMKAQAAAKASGAAAAVEAAGWHPSKSSKSSFPSPGPYMMTPESAMAFLMGTRSLPDASPAEVRRTVGESLAFDAAQTAEIAAIRTEAAAGRVAEVGALLSRCAGKPHMQRMHAAAISSAAARGREAVVELALSRAPVDAIPAGDSELNSAFAKATAAGHAAVVARLLADRRLDPTVRDCEALALAVLNDRAAIMEMYLADPRFGPLAVAHVALPAAANTDKVELVKRLLLLVRVEDGQAIYDAAREAFDRGARLASMVLMKDPRFPKSKSK